MAAISPISIKSALTTLRNAAAQANIGQTDWLWVPHWARFATVYFALTAAAGTTPVTNLTVLEADPVTLDDAYAGHIGGTTLTAQNTTATSGLLQIVHIGPAVAPNAATDDLALGATGINRAAINTMLPVVMGLGLVFDRTTGDETYTYKLAVHFKS
jgi:hypothetical protein